MALEAATFIDELVNTNPPGSDDASTIDEHLRLIKAVLLNSFANISGAVTATDVELNLLAAYTGAIPEVGTVQAWTRQQYFPEIALTDGTTIDWDLDVEQTAKVTLGGNRTLAAPTNMKAGGTYLLRIIQDGTGTRTLAYNSVFKFVSGLAPILTTDINAVDLLSCTSNGTNMYCVISLDLK